MQNKIIPDKRLLSAIPYVKQGGRIADIGTDHAYLPIYLVREGIVSSAIACDINEGPIQSAKSNIEASGLSSRIDTLRTDGLHGVERFAPDDVLVFGMGGELIVKILSEAPWIKNERIGLVLQPMSRVATLRHWLCQNGFEITGETVTFEDKYYQTIAARWSGNVTAYEEHEYLIGRLNIEKRADLFEGFVKHEIKVLEKIIAGKLQSHEADISEEVRMKEKLEALL